MTAVVEPGATVVVIGAGTMGRGIALVAAASGYDVRLVDTSAAALRAAAAYIADRLERAGDGDDRGTFTTVDDLVGALDGAGAVIEAVPELPEVKRSTFELLGAKADPATLLASNTSTMSIGDLAVAAGASPRVVGMHFFNPAHRMALVEVVHAPTTAAGTVADAVQLARHLGKEPIVVADVPGFVTSRLGLLLGNEAMRIVQEGVATAADVDVAMRLGYNHPMGPLELADLVGLDARLNNLRSVGERMGRPEFEPPAILVELVAAGKLGRKTGAGFHRYTADGRRADDPA
jgi:3-hydroxybutyryl-CoA dehydrogenase